MFSALKSLLVRDRKAVEPAFAPTTELAARIINGTKHTTPPVRVPQPIYAAPNSFELLAPPPEAAPDSPPSDAEDDLSRQAERFVPDRRNTMLSDKRGKWIRARIINVSATGVAVEADFSLFPPDAVVLVGQKPVTCGRAIRRGQVFVFEKPLDPSRCNPQLVL